MSDWISVKDRPPEDGEIIIYDGNEVSLAYHVAGEFWVLECYYGDMCFDKYDGVTHWMPLPEPPVDEEKEELQRLGQEILDPYRKIVEPPCPDPPCECYHTPKHPNCYCCYGYHRSD